MSRSYKIEIIVNGSYTWSSKLARKEKISAKMMQDYQEPHMSSCVRTSRIRMGDRSRSSRIGAMWRCKNIKSGNAHGSGNNIMTYPRVGNKTKGISEEDIT